MGLFLFASISPAQRIIKAKFKVTRVYATVSPKKYTGNCPFKFNFTGYITTNGKGTVKYRWTRKDGAIAPVKAIYFNKAETKKVTTSWYLGGAGKDYKNYWEAVQILSPNSITSNKALFSLYCKKASKTPVVKAIPKKETTHVTYPTGKTVLTPKPIPPLPGMTPTVEELAYHWAPLHYQDINKKEAQGSKDFVTSVDRGGVWDVSRNWDDFGNYPLNAWAYYSVVSTTSHYYITYAFYHPLDWDSGEDKNDFEGALFIIKRDSTRWGQLEAVITNWHSHFHAYFPEYTTLVSGCKIEEQGERWIQWKDGRVRTSQEWGGHGFGCYPAYVREGDDAVVYVPSQDTAGVPPSVPDGTHVEVPYRLVDIHASDGLWDHRYDQNVFDPNQSWLEMVGGHGNPPWAWDDVDDGGLCLKGIWTHDPALLAQYYFKLKGSTVESWEHFTREYLSNPYRNDMNILTHSNAKELYSNPQMSLDYWIKNHGGKCHDYAKQYPYD